MSLELQSLQKAIESYKNAVAFALNPEKMKSLSLEEKNTVKAGVIQNFEFTFELCWKFMKRWLSLNYINESSLDGMSRKELFRISAEHKLIQNTEKWFQYNKDRNRTSHIYDSDIAEDVFSTAIEFLDDAKYLFQALQKHND